RIGPNCPTVGESTPILEAIGAGPGRRAGAVLIVDSRGLLTGIFTDADLRRKLSEQGPGEWMHEPVATVMTRSPASLAETALVRDAVILTRERRVDEIPIIDASGRPVGVLDVQDLIAMRLVRGEQAPSAEPTS
ncbi:MAG: CBS domain-containing protein, partial [Phycisphaerales bacterium JB041]